MSDFYTAPGPFTSLEKHAAALQSLPRTTAGVLSVMHNVVIHPAQIGKARRDLSESQKEELFLRSASTMVDHIAERAPELFATKLPERSRMVLGPRGQAVLLTALLRHVGIPARARCGFAPSLAAEGHRDEYWICEQWLASAGRWEPIDPIGGTRSELTPHFVSAARAWQDCRSGKEDSRRFGFGRRRGLAYVRVALIKDFLCCNAVELLPTDVLWGFDTVATLSARELARLDRIADLLVAGEDRLAELLAAYETEAEYRAPVEALLSLTGRSAASPAAELGPAATAFLAATPHPAPGPAPPVKDAIGWGHLAASQPDKLIILGAHQHNLQHVNLSLPRNRLIVFTGVSGSGKSSLAFDTIHAEGQRRYVESLSPFVRQFLEKLERPKVDYIGNLSPTIAIEQKRISKNPRSTVGTVTEISQHLRLLYSRVGTPRCLHCALPVTPLSPREAAARLAAMPLGTAIEVRAPVVRNAKGNHAELLTHAAEGGFEEARIDGTLRSIAAVSKLAADKPHTIELVCGRVVVGPNAAESGRDAVRLIRRAMGEASDVALLDFGAAGHLYISPRRVCPNCGLQAAELTSQHFSPNSPFGMCPECKGLGLKLDVSVDKLIADPTRSIPDGALTWFGVLRNTRRTTWPLGPLDVIADSYGADLETPWKDLPEAFRHAILFGSGDKTILFPRQSGGTPTRRKLKGLVYEIGRLYRETKAESMQAKYEAFMTQQPCSACKGTRLGPDARSVTLAGATLAEVEGLPLSKVSEWLASVPASLTREQFAVAEELLADLASRVRFLLNVGLHYLTLSRTAPSLSGGEGQRIRLASQLGAGLVGVLYVLDEPSIGLHARDQEKLIAMLQRLRELGNGVLVVEHDLQTMLAAEWLVDLGPGAGTYGGRVLAQGTPAEVMASEDSVTGPYLAGTRSAVLSRHATREPKEWLTLYGARLHNLRGETARFPLGLLTCVTGVSGSGKSSLVLKTLYPALSRALGLAHEEPGPFDRLDGVGRLKNVVTVTQDAIGRTPRSNPATYIGAFDVIRDVFSDLPDATRRGFTARHFSFNSADGQCPACKGYGQRRIEMHFLADVWVPCQECGGTRYQEEVLDVRYRGRNIAEVLALEAREALALFKENARLQRILGALVDVGLAYVKLGQSALTLSGGEAQRVKLANELSQQSTGRTLYLLDEPTTGLHFADVRGLLEVLDRLVEAGNTVIVVEHNLDVIESADWVIDMGPDGGDDGGRIIAEGAPDAIRRCAESHTGRFLASEMRGRG